MSESPIKPTRLCFALDLEEDPDLIATYKAWHAPGRVPAPVLEALYSQDIVAMEIYCCGNRLFMIMETGPGFNAVSASENDAINADVQAWQTLMWKFQRALPFAQPGEKWIQMEPIFHLPSTHT